MHKYFVHDHMYFQKIGKGFEGLWSTSSSILTPNAEYLLDFLFWAWSRKTSDFGLGGLRGLRITLTSSPISSSSSLESEEVDS